MIKEYQVTLMCEQGTYKPVSCLIKKDVSDLFRLGQKAFTEEVKKAGIKKICQTKLWHTKDLATYGYTKVKVREYNKEKIEQENKERYEKIKEEKYNTGEWKRPKAKTKD